MPAPDRELPDSHRDARELVLCIDLNARYPIATDEPDTLDLVRPARCVARHFAADLPQQRSLYQFSPDRGQAPKQLRRTRRGNARIIHLQQFVIALAVSSALQNSVNVVEDITHAEFGTRHLAPAVEGNSQPCSSTDRLAEISRDVRLAFTCPPPLIVKRQTVERTGLRTATTENIQINQAFRSEGQIPSRRARHLALAAHQQRDVLISNCKMIHHLASWHTVEAPRTSRIPSPTMIERAVAVWKHSSKR